MAQPARQISAAKLKNLLKAAEACNSRMAEERQALGAKFEAAETADNFNVKAFRIIRQLAKMDPGPQAHLWRTICLYAEHLDIGAQSDLEDVIDAQKAAEERGGGGEGGDEGDEDGGGEAGGGDDEGEGQDAAGDPVDELLANMDTPALGRFRSAIQDAVTPEAVNKGLENFTANYPSAADEALVIATARLEAIAAEQGGGEDLRPDSLRKAATTEAGQVADIAKERAKRPRRPRSPAAENAAALGGSDFGNAEQPSTKH